jgi:hypothetical protein
MFECNFFKRMMSASCSQYCRKTMEEESEENAVDHLIKFEHDILCGVLIPASF